MFAKKITAILSIMVTVMTMTLTTSAHGFAFVIDTTLAFCNEDFTAGAVELDLGQYNFSSGGDNSQCNDSSRFDPFSVKVGDTFYDSIYLNNDGLITFGSAYAGTVTNLTDSSFGPAIAGLFRDSPIETPTDGRISWGGSDAALVEFLSIDYSGIDTFYQLNLFNRDDLAAGDFDVHLNYTFNADPVLLGNAPAQIGFNNGAGQSYLYPGSGIAGAFNGSQTDCGTAAASPNSLACNSLGSSVAGRLVFEFRDGEVTNLPVVGVSEPGTGLLMLLGLLGLAPLRRRLAAK